MYIMLAFLFTCSSLCVRTAMAPENWNLYRLFVVSVLHLQVVLQLFIWPVCNQDLGVCTCILTHGDAWLTLGVISMECAASIFIVHRYETLPDYFQHFWAFCACLSLTRQNHWCSQLCSFAAFCALLFCRSFAYFLVFILFQNLFVSVCPFFNPQIYTRAAATCCSLSFSLSLSAFFCYAMPFTPWFMRHCFDIWVILWWLGLVKSVM